MLNYQNQLLSDKEMIEEGFYYVQSSVMKAQGNWIHDTGIKYSTYKSRWTLHNKEIYPTQKEQIYSYTGLFKPKI